MAKKSLVRTILLVICILTGAAPGWGANKPAPDFTLKDVLQGQDHSLSQFKGKVVMINFFTFFAVRAGRRCPT